MDNFNHPNLDYGFYGSNSLGNDSFANSLGVNLNQEPREFLRSIGMNSGYFLTDEEIQTALNNYKFVESNTNKGVKVVRVRKDSKERKTNRNHRLENLNLTDGLFSAAKETESFYDAAGLRKNTVAEKMNLDPHQPLHPLGFGAANALFFDDAKDALAAMENQAAMASALAAQLHLNVQRAKQLYSIQGTISQLETGHSNVPMTGGLRSLMNQSKMKLETFCIGASSWLSGMYLPKITMCLNTAMFRPQSRTIAQSFLKKLDAALNELDKGKELGESFLQELDEVHAAFYNELRRSGLTAALSKQMRGAFGAHQKRADHQHSVFVTASLREQLYYYISTAPMQIGRRMSDSQFPLPRLLVAAERFIDTDVLGTVDAFRAGGIQTFIPPNIMDGPQIFQQEQFDGGGSIGLLTCKTLRPEFTAVGVKEAEDNLQSQTKNLVSLGEEELKKAASQTYSMNITTTTRTNEDRCNIREMATERDKDSNAEKSDFVRQGSWIYITDHAPTNIARELKSSNNKISPYSEIHASSIPGNFILPQSHSLPDSSSSSSSLENFTSNLSVTFLKEQSEFASEVFHIQNYFQEKNFGQENILEKNFEEKNFGQENILEKNFEEKNSGQENILEEKNFEEKNVGQENNLEKEKYFSLEEETTTTISSSSSKKKVSQKLPLQDEDHVTSITTSTTPASNPKKRKAKDISMEEEVKKSSSRQERLLHRKMRFSESESQWIGAEPDVPEKFRQEETTTTVPVPKEIDGLKSSFVSTKHVNLPSSILSSFAPVDYTAINAALLTFFKENTVAEPKSKQELLSSFVKQFILEDGVNAFEEEHEV